MPRAPVWKERQSQYLQRCSDRMLSQRTLTTYRSALDCIFDLAVWLDWPLHPAKVTPDNVRELYYQMVEDGLSTATQKLYTTVLMDFLDFCGNKHCRDVRLRITVSRTNVNWLSELEVSEIIQAADSPQLLAALVLMSYCGLRREEVVELRRADMSMNRLRVNGKGAKDRTIPLDLAFWRALQPYTDWAQRHARTDRFLSHLDNFGEISPYSKNGISTMFKRFSKKLDKDFSPHTFRRSFGRHLYKRGCPLAELKVLMGHANIETTIKYLGIGADDIEHAITFRPDYAGSLK